MDVELLVVPGCRHEAAAESVLRTALDQVGLSRLRPTTTVIYTQQVAERRGFGVDPFAEPGASPALACRLYPSSAEPSGVPDLGALRAALAGCPYPNASR
jgi:hypothetical protein